MATFSKSTRKLDELKKEVVEVLLSCDGHRLDLGQFKPEYKRKFRMEFNRKRYALRKGSGGKLINIMGEISDVVSLETVDSGIVIVLNEDSTFVRNKSSSEEKHKSNQKAPLPSTAKKKVSSTTAAVTSSLPPPQGTPTISFAAISNELAKKGTALSQEISQSIDAADRDRHIPEEVGSLYTPPFGNVLSASSPLLSPPGQRAAGPVSTPDLATLMDSERCTISGNILEGEQATGHVTQMARPSYWGLLGTPPLACSMLSGGGELSQQSFACSPQSDGLEQKNALQGKQAKPVTVPPRMPHSPYMGLLGSPPSGSTFPTLPPPIIGQNLSPGAVGFGVIATPPQTMETRRNLTTSPAVSLRSIMEQQAQEEKSARNIPVSPFLDSKDMKDDRVRKIGEPGPFEDSFNQAQRIQANSSQAKPARNATLLEVNKVTENIIRSLSEEGRYVSLEVVKAKLCREFGKSSIKALGFKRDVDIPALQELIKLQEKVSLFVHAYVMSNSIATLYELNQSVADLQSKPDFQELNLGPLLKQPVVYDLFKAPQDLPSVPHVTTIHILKHLEKYMDREDLWRKKVDLKKFLEYLCEEYRFETPYELGVKIQSIGLAISVIKKAKSAGSQHWKAAREQISEDTVAEIEAHLRKIKRDLLGQEVGDLRSRAMKLLDASPVDVLHQIFSCCEELFDGKRHNKVAKFLTMVTSDSLGRRLFQLALHVGCSRLIRPMPEEACVEAGHVQPQEKDSTQDNQSNKPVPPSEGKLVEEVKQWLTQADTLDLPRLARIEGTIVRKFPAFSGFEAFGYGSFLHFLAKHKELLEAVDEVGGMARAGGDGSRLGLRVSLSSILDFISQCGTHTSPDVIERSLCTYYGVSKVTDLGLGSCSRLLQKAAERRQNPSGINTHSIVYEAALLCNDAVKREGGTGDTEPHHGAVLGWKSKEEAMTAIRGSPLLEDVAQWTHWDEVFGGHVSKLGDLSTFLENERILMNVGKSSSQSGDAIVVMETSPGELLRVTKDTSPEMFHQCVSRGDALGTAGHLVSMVIVNGGVSNTPVALLANHVRSSLASLASSEASGYSQCSGFVLDCLLRIPRRLAKAVGAKVFLEPLKEIAGSTQAPELLISSCSTQSQRSRLHQLGFVLGVNQWIEDFRRRISSSEEDNKDSATHQEKKQNRPIAVVKPVPPPREIIKQKLDDEESDDALRNAVEDSSGEASIADEMDSGAEDTSPKASTPCVDQQEECRALIEQIRREDFGIGLVLGEEESKLVNRQREREGRGLHRLSTELYSRDTHFVLELVQNADDNSYSEECTGAGHPSLVFILQPDKIVVLNNEEGFVEKNIRALCDVGRSTKGAHRYGYIGQKGIGFKSVFRVSDSPEVHSNGFHIRFDAESGPIGYILPQWIDENTKARERGDEEEEEGEEEIQGTDRVQEQEEAAQESQAGATEDEFEGWATRIVLPLKDEHQGVERSSLAARFRDVHPSLLLFLHRLRRITIQDKTNNIHREMVRRDLGENVMEVCHTDGTDRWLVIKKQFDSSKIKEDIEMTELALAFPLLNDTNSSQHEAMGRRHQTLPQQNVFAYLPLRSYGFRFIIQGDFEVPSSREDVDTDKPWNQWLREEIPPLFIEALNVFMGHSSFFGLSSVAAYFQFVPLEEEILDFFTPVARHILKLLQGTPCMPVIRTSKENDQPSSSSGEDSSDSYEWVLPCKAIVCHDSTTLELITPALLEEHLGLFYLHPAMIHALNPTLRSRLGIETLSSKHLIEIGKAEVKKASSQSSVTLPHSAGGTPDVVRISWVARWLQCVYRCLEQERDSSQDVLDVIGSLSVVPLTDGTFVHLKGDSLFFPLSLKKTSEKSVRKKKAASGKTSQEQSNFSVLEEDLSTVHPALFSSLDDIGRSQVEELLKRLGVKSWTPRELINSHILPAFKSDKWKAKSNKVLTSYLVYIHEQRLTDPSVCDIDDLRSCVQILTNKGVSNPSETPVHFTPKYGNNIDLARQLPSISWALIDDSYLTSTAHIHELTVFLAELGVKRFLAITRKQVKLDRNSMAQSPWSSYINIWPTTPDGLYLVDDWACDEFEEFIGKIVTSENSQLVSPEESRILAECIDEQWDKEYAKFADDPVRYKDTNGHVLGETESSFYLNLVSKPWMASSDGRSSTRAEMTPSLFQPKELFVRTESVYGLLEDHVKYVAANLKSDAFVNALRIRESVNVDELLKEMTRWSSNAEKASQGNQARGFTTSLAHMRRVYHFLLYRSQEAVDRRTIQDAFHRNALIFIPDQSLDSSSVQSQANHQCPGFFYKKKEVCWRDPTGVALKLTKEHRKVTTRHLLEQHYSNSQPSISSFFIDDLNVDETPNMDEYIEMAAAVSEVSGFPSPSSLDSMFKIFSILGRKCVARGHNDSIRVEAEIDENMSSFLKQRLGKEQKMIFPSLDRWVALSDKPLVPDDKTLEKIFQKEKGVHFLDLGNLFRPPKARSSSRVPNHERQEIQANVSLFLRACMVQNLTECVEKEFVPEMVQYQCVPLQKYFHQMIPSVQRFLYSKMPDLYMELKHKGFAQKLSEMKFATVKSLETVYSLSTHPEVRIPVEEKSGVEVVGSSYCFYVMKEHQSKFEVFNAEMVKLFQVGKKTSSEFSNFLVAVGSYQGNDLEHFLEEMQGLESMPEEEELWCVPPPEEPDIPEIEKEEEPTEVFPSLYSAAATQSKGDNELHSWPPKSSSQFDGVRRGQGASTDDTLKMWPPPAPPDSVKVETREDQNQGKPGQQGNSTIDRPKENDGMIIEHECPLQLAPGVQHVSSAMGTEATSAGDRHFERTGINPTTATEGKPPEPCNEPLAASDERAPQGQPDGSSLQRPEHPTPAGDQFTPTSRLTGPRDGVKHSFQSFLFRQGPSLDISFEELPLDSDVKMLKQIDFKENPNKEEVGRWGEQAVFEFLMSQAKYPPQGEEVEIRWMNEAENTTAPYDFEILRRSTDMECNASNKTVTTYIEVKTTSSDQKEVFEISAQELLFALEKRDALHLYRVFNAGQPSRVRLLRLQNVAAHLEKKSLKLCMVI